MGSPINLLMNHSSILFLIMDIRKRDKEQLQTLLRHGAGGTFKGINGRIEWAMSIDESSFLRGLKKTLKPLLEGMGHLIMYNS